MDSGRSFRFSGGNSAGTDAPAEFSDSSAGNGGDFRHISLASADPRVALFNLSLLRQKMDTLQQFLSESLHRDTLIGKDRMDMVSTEIVSAIQQVIVNGAALISCSQDQNLGSRVKECHPVMMTREVPVQPDVMMMPSTSSLVTGKVTNPGCSSAGKDSMSSLVTVKAAEPAYPTAGTNHPFTEKTRISADSRGRRCNSRAPSAADIKIGMTSTLISDHPKNIGYLKVAAAADEEMKYEVDDGDCEIVELDAVELLEEHIHHCEICGKGFKRDANLRMHMRAHGNQFKTLEALAKPDRWAGSSLKTRFSCPFEGCNRNKSHKKFRPLKSIICVKNHFKRSHCPKLFSCNRCNKKSFSVVADLKSHLKHCGESKWRCSCGTSFSRKDKLFGHMALFEGHMPAVARENGESNGAVLVEDDVDLEEEEEEETQLEGVPAGNYSDDGFFDDLLKGFDAIDGGCLKDVLGSSDLGIGMDEFYKI